ncbi:hypothetical protein F8514_05470 [Bacillus toyonensis]|uniref:Uncharacterized protein n=1 Tax=Bacillus toyonensis TaxID=155322 RepID=A0ABX6GGP7_9BACI|nr:hypothetical protein DPQ31_21925 [Bacillus sp. COPE52]KAB2360965.1 hypothetical protein F8503_08330 [Bacillus toyonensis]MBH0362130.1 hypothetical protein [Bacillus toyonensis biovar Thuringiensis]QEQ20250.1 hypothetical protein F0362_21050 [Bacillus sp. BS98]KAB2384464.1 hypothetical protein F8507_14425 [Bacillus toyonensis]
MISHHLLSFLFIQ